MGKDCYAPTPDNSNAPKYRKVLWLALAINGLMFVIEMTSGIMAGSVSLQADAIDFLGDAANYGISLFVLGMALNVRAQAAYLKGLSMAAVPWFLWAYRTGDSNMRWMSLAPNPAGRIWSWLY